MSKKNKTPFALRAVQWFFPKLEAVAPSLAHRYFVHLFYTPFRYELPEKEKTFMKTATEFSVDVKGLRIQCYRWGQAGRKVLLVHGWAGRAGQFRGIIPALLAQGYQCVAFDGPAHGKSEGKSTDLLQYADALSEIIKVEKEFYAIIAHSFGGVASLFAISKGFPVRKLVNISSPTIAENIINSYRHALNASPASGLAFRAHLMKKYGFTFEEVSSLYLVQHLPEPIDLLLVQDEDDTEVALENSIELRKVYPAASLYITKGLGHTRILRDEGVISTCLEFLNRDQGNI